MNDPFEKHLKETVAAKQCIHWAPGRPDTKPVGLFAMVHKDGYRCENYLCAMCVELEINQGPWAGERVQEQDTEQLDLLIT
jgi:hypothetical protein